MTTPECDQRAAASGGPPPPPVVERDRRRASPLFSRRTTRFAAAGALFLLGLWILWDFLPALAWACVLAIIAWPAYGRFARRLAARRRHGAATAATTGFVAPLLFTLLIGLIFVVPLAFAAIEAGREAHTLVRWVAEVQRTGLPVPDWLPRLPTVGRWADEWWRENLSDPEAAGDLLGRIDKAALSQWTRSLGLQLLRRATIFAVTLLTLFFLFRDGAALLDDLRRLSDRLLGPRGERLAAAMIAAVRGTVDGLVLVGLGEGALLGVAYAATGVPHPVLVGAATAVLAAIPFGAPVHSRQRVMSAAMTAGPTNSPSRPNASSPPRMPSRTQRNGSRAAPPISTGRTKWSATNTTARPMPTSTAAAPALPSARRTSAAPQNATGAPNGMAATTAVAAPTSTGCGTPVAA